MDVQTELDTIRKSILRRWYAVKIILVSPTSTRQAQEAGGGEKGDGGVWDEAGSQTQRQFVLA